MFALLEAYKAGLLGRSHWARNIVAGLIVGVVALPLAMAFAIASGAKPEQGLYTAIVAGLCVSVFGGSRVQIAGPTGAFIVILSGIVATHGIQGLQIATLMAGVILVLLGVARLGAVIRFIPQPVIVGFTAGIGVIIFVGQWKDFFGLPVQPVGHFHEKLFLMLGSLPDLSIAATLFGTGSLALILAVPKVSRFSRIPGPLVALLVMTVLQSVFQFKGVPTIGSVFGELPRGLPGFEWPELTVSRMVELIGPAFAIAMLGAIESLLSAVVADSMSGTRHNSNQELIGQGLANIAAPLFGGIAATGAIARTATNIKNGGTSPLAGLVHALTLVLVILFLAPYARNVPLATLAAILFVVAWNMSELPHMARLMRRAPRADVFILLLTFVLTVFADLVVAVNIGVVVAMLHFLRRMADSVVVSRQSAASIQQELAMAADTLPAGLSVYVVEGPLFYGASEHFVDRFDITAHGPGDTVVIRLGRVPFIDATGLQSLEKVVRGLVARGVGVVLAETNNRVQAKIRKMGFAEKGSGVTLRPSFAQALQPDS
ncbi:MAG: SulP family inorganic anion transporter [Pusillimonas sp.]